MIKCPYCGYDGSDLTIGMKMPAIDNLGVPHIICSKCRNRFNTAGMMEMRKYRVMPIEDIVTLYPQFNNKTATIVITTNHYDYGFVPTLELDFFDVFKDDKQFITKEHVKKLKNKLPEIAKAERIIVGCDAGISRSPAVATAIAKYLGDIWSYTDLITKYHYMNKDVYDFISEELKDL